ncbi:MAG: cell-division ATP-binding protein [Pseudobdellovibrio sp.]|nr:cell-division ATP-binding protein [Pseudobdellovibrio sp.]
MIEFKHVYKAYLANVPCLRDVSFRVNEGDFVFVVGPSGAGKTTLFKLMTAYESKNTGEINVLGHNLSSLKKGQIPFLRREIGMVLQNYKLLKNKTVFENIELPLIIRGLSADERIEKTEQIIEKVGLKEYRDQFPDFLSGGEQQRVAIARALVHSPKIVIADEPTGNLDSELSQSIMKLFKDFSKQGVTFLVATHDERLLKTSESRVLRLNKGLVSEDVQ